MELSETLEGKLKPLGYFPLMHSCALPWCFVHPGFFALEHHECLPGPLPPLLGNPKRRGRSPAGSVAQRSERRQG